MTTFTRINEDTVCVKVPSSTEQVQKEPHLILVLDVSGSMSGTPLRNAWEACKKLVVERTKDVTLIEYSGQATTRVLNPDRFETYNPSTQGMTSFGAAFTALLSSLQKTFRDDPRNEARVVFLTDGHETVDRAGSWRKKMEEVQKYSKKFDIEFLSVGIGDSDTQMLIDLANMSPRGQGSYGFAKNSQDIGKEIERLREVIGGYNYAIYNGRKYAIGDDGYATIYEVDTEKKCDPAPSDDRVKFIYQRAMEMCRRTNLSLREIENFQAKVKTMADEFKKLPKFERKKVLTELQQVYSLINDMHEVFSKSMSGRVDNMHLAQLNNRARELREGRFAKQANAIADQNAKILDDTGRWVHEYVEKLPEGPLDVPNDILCAHSLQSVDEAIRDETAMGIGIRVNAMKAVLANPLGECDGHSLLKIMGVGPSYYTVDALEEAGGFTASQRDDRFANRIFTIGGAREEVSGTVPLWLSDVHGPIAMRLFRQAAGLICTGDPLLGTNAQVAAVLLSVREWLEPKKDESENYRTIFGRVDETCKKFFGRESTQKYFPTPEQFRDNIWCRLQKTESANQPASADCLKLMRQYWRVMGYEVDAQTEKYIREERVRRKLSNQGNKAFNLYRALGIDKSFWVTSYVDATSVGESKRDISTQNWTSWLRNRLIADGIVDGSAPVPGESNRGSSNQTDMSIYSLDRITFVPNPIEVVTNAFPDELPLVQIALFYQCLHHDSVKKRAAEYRDLFTETAARDYLSDLVLEQVRNDRSSLITSRQTNMRNQKIDECIREIRAGASDTDFIAMVMRYGGIGCGSLPQFAEVSQNIRQLRAIVTNRFRPSDYFTVLPGKEETTVQLMRTEDARHHDFDRWYPSQSRLARFYRTFKWMSESDCIGLWPDWNNGFKISQHSGNVPGHIERLYERCERD